MKDYDKIKNHHIFHIGLINNLYVWAMSQKPSVNNFEWIKNTSEINKDLIKTIIKKVM